MKKIFSGKTFLIVVIMIFAAEFIYHTVMMFRPDEAVYEAIAAGVYVHLFGTIAGSLILLGLPLVASKKFRLVIPEQTMALYALMIFLAMFGVLREWYYIFRPYDIIMHFVGCGLLVLLGFAIAGLMHGSENSPSPLLVALFAFGFSMSLGVFWELLEFGMDYFNGTNSQHHSAYGGIPFVGQAALMNTMLDLLANTAGALAASIAGFVSLKRKKDWLVQFYITKST